MSEAPEDADRDDSADRRASNEPVLGGTLGGARAPGASSAPSATEHSSKAQRKDSAVADSVASAEAAATGIGRDVGHEVQTVEFQHESHPSATARLRYGFRDELVQLGVLPRPRPVTPWQRREVASGFAPDPYCPVR